MVPSLPPSSRSRRAPRLTRRLATGLLGGLLLVAPGCGDGPAPPAPAEMLWETPELPWPWAMEVGGRAVDEEVLRGFLDGEWADYAAAESVAADGVMAALDGFCADPEARFGFLVGDVLLLWEGERRFPVLDKDEFDAFRSRMEAAAGSAMEALRLRLGEEALERFVQRRFRLDRTLDELVGELAEPTEAELLEAYRAATDGIELPEGAVGPTFEEMEPRLRRDLLRQRRVDAGFAWIAAAREGVLARVTRPDGRILDVPAP